MCTEWVSHVLLRAQNCTQYQFCSVVSMRRALQGEGAKPCVMVKMQGVALHAGVVQAGVQFTLFCALFYYLLAAEADPLLYAVRLLPLSDGARQQAATALSDALRGVFLCALKVEPYWLALHGIFTFLRL